MDFRGNEQYVPTARWRQLDDGSWTPDRTPWGGQAVPLIDTSGGSQSATGIWHYIASTAVADPGSGNVGWSALHGPTATIMSISRLTLSSSDASAFLSALTTGDNITVQMDTDSARWARYTVAGPVTTEAGWFEVPVTFVAASTSPPAVDSDVSLRFIYSGGTDGGGGGDPEVIIDTDSPVWISDLKLWVDPDANDEIPAGPPGPQGPQGIKGDTGSQGIPGPVGPAGLNWQGAYTASSTYSVDDSVEYQGSSYMANAPVPENEIPGVSPYWDLLAQKGDAGPAGPPLGAYSASLYTDGAGVTSLPNDVSTVITFNLVWYDTAGLYSAANPSRLTAPVDGLYLVVASVGIGSNTTGYRELIINRNGSNVARTRQQTLANAVGSQLICTKYIPLTAGQYVEAVARQNSTAVLSTVSGLSWTSFQMTRVGDY